MPVHPIGEVERKGRLGSPYAVRDYQAVNPEFGSLEDLRAFVERAHTLGLDVILDWVANHTAHDHPWVTEHPDWYRRDREGQPMSPPWCDWDDVLDLDLSQPGARKAMAEALRFWVEEVGVDGFRCDVAGFVPLGFWEEVRAELETTRPVFLLAEWEERDLHAQGLRRHLRLDLAEGAGGHRPGARGRARPRAVGLDPREGLEPRRSADAVRQQPRQERLGGRGRGAVRGRGAPRPRPRVPHGGTADGPQRRRGGTAAAAGLLRVLDPIARVRTRPPAPGGLAGRPRATPDGAPRAAPTALRRAAQKPVGHDQRGSGFAFLREAEGEKVLVLANLTGRGLGCASPTPTCSLLARGLGPDRAHGRGSAGHRGRSAGPDRVGSSACWSAP